MAKLHSMSIINEMPDHSRIWVYQANRTFSPEEKQFISAQLRQFTDQWAAHGRQLAANFSIEKDQFIVLAVDETQHAASGCSIDASVHIIQHIEQETGLSLLDRTAVAFMNGETVNIRPFNQIKQAVVDGEIKEDTIIFNNTVQNAGDWKAQWQQPATESWVKRFFA